MLVNVFLIWIFLQVSFRWMDGSKIRSQLITLSVSDISKKSNQPVNFFQTVFFQVLFQGFTFKQSSDEKKKEAGVRLIIKWRFSHHFNQPGWIYPVREGEMQCCPEKSEEFQGFLHQEKNSWVGWLDLAWVCCISDLHHFGEEYVLWYFVEQHILRYSSEKYYEIFWCGCFHPFLFLPLALEMEQF